MSLQNMIDSINELHTKYKDQPAILCKMEEYMNKQLPHALDLFVDRINRKFENLVLIKLR